MALLLSAIGLAAAPKPDRPDQTPKSGPEPMKVTLIAFNMTCFCCHCGQSLFHRKGIGPDGAPKGVMYHDKHKNFYRVSDCPFAGMTFRLPTVELEPV
jgi:hypothetical protein